MNTSDVNNRTKHEPFSNESVPEDTLKLVPRIFAEIRQRTRNTHANTYKTVDKFIRVKQLLNKPVNTKYRVKCVKEASDFKTPRPPKPSGKLNFLMTATKLPFNSPRLSTSSNPPSKAIYPMKSIKLPPKDLNQPAKSSGKYRIKLKPPPISDISQEEILKKVLARILTPRFTSRRASPAGAATQRISPTNMSMQEKRQRWYDKRQRFFLNEDSNKKHASRFNMSRVSVSTLFGSKRSTQTLSKVSHKEKSREEVKVEEPVIREETKDKANVIEDEEDKLLRLVDKSRVESDILSLSNVKKLKMLKRIQDHMNHVWSTRNLSLFNRRYTTAPKPSG